MSDLESDSPVYEITDAGLKRVSNLAVPAEEPKPALGRISLQLALLGALAALLLDSKEWFEAAEKKISRHQDQAMLEPYRHWARTHPTSWDEVSANPDGYLGKSVQWEISAAEGPVYYCAGDPAKTVRWAPGPAEGLPNPGDAPVRALGRVEGAQDNAPLLFLLETP